MASSTVKASAEAVDTAPATARGISDACIFVLASPTRSGTRLWHHGSNRSERSPVRRTSPWPHYPNGRQAHRPYRPTGALVVLSTGATGQSGTGVGSLFL